MNEHFDTLYGEKPKGDAVNLKEGALKGILWEEYVFGRTIGGEADIEFSGPAMIRSEDVLHAGE